MQRPALFIACVGWVLSVAWAARADDLDLTLSRFRLAPQACMPAETFSDVRCPDQELFERLTSELAVAMAPPVASVARTIGPRGFQLALSSTVTSIEGGKLYWRYGVEGPRVDPPPGEQEGGESSPPSAFVWNHLHVRKGLPFGFELGLLLGQGLRSSMWSMGAALKWALFEGFRTGLGQLPDVSLQAAVNRSIGSSQVTVQLYAFDIAFSKPFVIAHTWAISPLLGLQLLAADVESGVIDLTPGGPPASDAYGSCDPLPGHQPTAMRVCAEGGSDDDFANNVVFDPVANQRLRMFLGGNLRYQMLTLSLSLLFDVTAPDLEVDSHPQLDSDQVAHQVAFNATVGVVL